MRLPSVLDYRFWLLLAAFCLSVIASFQPQWRTQQDRPEVLFVVDITGSMNVRDYGPEGHLHSRLDEVRQRLQQTLVRLPCGSRVALAVFSERRAFLLLEPIEVCENFASLSDTIAELDWRMAWEGDSYITKGLESALEMAKGMNLSVVYMTDGHEAPPLPAAQTQIGHMMMQGEAEVRAQTLNRSPSPRADASAAEGVIVGVGGAKLSPIPKFDETGHQIGFFGADEVEQENRNGPPPADAANREGWHARNAPYGARPATGVEHFSSLKEPHLRSLATAYGLAYTTLGSAIDLSKTIVAHSKKHQVATPVRLTPYLAGLACALSVIFYMSAFSGVRRRGLFRSAGHPAKSVSFTS
ncbi:von Willebrand factor A [Advenella kashmirensis W13003]|uniref:von Willebrand factor A n=1 Tax=Advenella kashmirensis W13003 TaxID=1424334 RepID=V8QM59_9BURK|nr:vWA domain-containing protein [Advenella kashmirensis]ETF00405.1 von Willebrand factor A [Advenella kashmirensis W13003]